MEDRPRYAVLVPVKPTSRGKSRLRALGERARCDLALAFAQDTVAAALACPRVDHVVVVTDDLDVGRHLAALGATVVADSEQDDLNVSLVHAAADLHHKHPKASIGALCADLPALRPGELDAALGGASREYMSFVSDADRIGTTVVTAPDVERFRPTFGLRSRDAHLSAGAVEVAGELPSVRRDVDTPDHLVTAMALGVGARTRETVLRLGLASLAS